MSTPIFRAFGISRLRMGNDGEGVTTLVAGYGCPLRCRYCLNPQSWAAGTKTRDYTPAELYSIVRRDDLYYRATGGGVTFGGGEPLGYADFLPAFREICGDGWQLNLETSLAVGRDAVEATVGVIDTYFVDVKTGDDAVYRSYTGYDGALAWANLAYLSARVDPGRIIARVPDIPGYTDADTIARTLERLAAIGITRTDRFGYRLPKGETAPSKPDLPLMGKIAQPED